MARRPRLGHEALYRPPSGWKTDALWRAIITRIHDEDSVGLIAFRPDGGIESVLSARYGHGPGDWCWDVPEEEDPC